MRRLYITQRRFYVLSPAGATRCTDGVKCGVEEYTVGPFLYAKFGSDR